MNVSTQGSYVYGDKFQYMASAGSVHAARRVIAIVKSIMDIGSVVDVGCARGTWLREWAAQGAHDIVGIDGHYVDRAALEIPPERFLVRNLAEPFRIGRFFDLAQSLEVAEHLPSVRAASFVADLASCAPVVLFSATTPGQGGENHLNEQSYEYWRALFAKHGYVPLDCIRPLLAGDIRIPAWYRYNLLFYVNRNKLVQVPPFARHFEVPNVTPIADISPLRYRVRKAVVRSLPGFARNYAARFNACRFATGHSATPSASGDAATSSGG